MCIHISAAARSRGPFACGRPSDTPSKYRLGWAENGCDTRSRTLGKLERFLVIRDGCTIGQQPLGCPLEPASQGRAFEGARLSDLGGTQCSSMKASERQGDLMNASRWL
jgi:hypothetical protein